MSPSKRASNIDDNEYDSDTIVVANKRKDRAPSPPPSLGFIASVPLAFASSGLEDLEEGWSEFKLRGINKNSNAISFAEQLEADTPSPSPTPARRSRESSQSSSAPSALSEQEDSETPWPSNISVSDDRSNRSNDSDSDALVVARKPKLRAPSSSPSRKSQDSSPASSAPSKQKTKMTFEQMLLMDDSDYESNDRNNESDDSDELVLTVKRKNQIPSSSPSLKSSALSSASSEDDNLDEVWSKVRADKQRRRRLVVPISSSSADSSSVLTSVYGYVHYTPYFSPKPLPEGCCPILDLPPEILVMILSFCEIGSTEPLVAATQEESGEWTCREEREIDNSLSKKTKRLVPKEKPVTQHSILRRVSRMFKQCADHAHTTDSFFCIRVHHWPDLRSKRIILNEKPMAPLVLDFIRHAEIEIQLLIETQSRTGLSQHLRWCAFHIHTRPENTIKCVQTAGDDTGYLGRLSLESRGLAEDYVEIVEQKGMTILKSLRSGRGWLEDMLRLMTLGMDISQKNCGFGGKSAYYRAVRDKITELKTELAEQQDVVQKEEAGSTEEAGVTEQASPGEQAEEAKDEEAEETA